MALMGWDLFNIEIGMFYTLDRLRLCRAYVDDGGSGHASPTIIVGNLKPNTLPGSQWLSETKYMRKCILEDGFE